MRISAVTVCRTISPLIFFFVVIGILVTDQKARAGEKTTIEPYDSLEKCMELKQGESVMYSFTSEEPVDFDLHYHADGKTRYPLKKSAVTEHRGTFTARSDREYCLYWGNPTDYRIEIEVEYRIGRR